MRTHFETDAQGYSEMVDRQRDRQTDRPTARQTDRKTGRQTDIGTNVQLIDGRMVRGGLGGIL